MQIKAITLWQPWASLVVAGHKRFETRSWRTGYRGPLAIHASKREPGHARKLACAERTFSNALIAMGLRDLDLWPRGVMLGVVQLATVCTTESIRPTLTFEELAFGDYRNGRYAWKLLNPIPFPEPIPIRGRQGLWNWTVPPDIQHLVPMNQP